jgi:ABC-type uncharacterized transport system substrate-binding protein
MKRAAVPSFLVAVVLLAVGGHSPIMNSCQAQIIDTAMRSRLPAIYDAPQFVERGGLMSYNASTSELYRHAATYVDKILKGRQASGPAGRATDKV